MAALLRRVACTALLRATTQARSSYVAPAAPQHPGALSAMLIGTCRTKKTWPVSFSQEELKQRLTPMQYHVTQERGTESAFRGEFTDHKEDGTYTCVVCGAPLFKSGTKFNSRSGWPSFFDLVKDGSVTLADDFSHGVHRVETTCSQCGAHLGHLFDDGPRPTGKRYCINSASLGFQGGSEADAVATETAAAAAAAATATASEDGAKAGGRPASTGAPAGGKKEL